jgi:hypothetical protein
MTPFNQPVCITSGSMFVFRGVRNRARRMRRAGKPRMADPGLQQCMTALRRKFARSGQGWLHSGPENKRDPRLDQDRRCLSSQGGPRLQHRTEGLPDRRPPRNPAARRQRRPKVDLFTHPLAGLWAPFFCLPRCNDEYRVRRAHLKWSARFVLRTVRNRGETYASSGICHDGKSLAFCALHDGNSAESFPRSLQGRIHGGSQSK